MTVLVRPHPSRVWANGIHPFRSVPAANNIRPYTLKTWRPPVPEPLPPAPLLGIPSLLALGALVLSQLWGLFAGPPRVVAPEQGPGNVSGSYHNGNGGSTYIWRVQIDGELLFYRNYKVANVTGWTTEDDYYLAGYADFGNQGGGVYDISFQFYLPRDEYSGWYLEPVPADGLTPSPAPGTEPVEVPYDQPRPITPTVSPPLPFPWITPEELAILRPRPLPLPGGEDLPDPGNPQPQPAPEVPPFPLPVPAPPLVPPLPPGQILPPGFPPPVPVPPAPVPTPPDWHFPVPGLPIPPAPPPPTLDGIALEVGRIENKVAKLLTPGGGTPLDQLGTLVSLVSTLLEILQSITGGGSYTLEAPCETAEDGSPLVVEHPYSGALNSFGVLSNKLDAIAAVLQTHKNQKQPICKAPPRQGQAVTVNFEEV